MVTYPKIVWKYRYLEKGDKVTPDDIINTTPDEHNRWMIVGYVVMKTKAMPEYKPFGKIIYIPMVAIHQKGCAGAVVPSIVDKFSCKIPHITDANIGFSEGYIYGSTPNEVMEEAQRCFEQTYKCFVNFV